MKKIIWAVDPLTTDVSLLTSAARAIRSLVASGGYVVEPVFVWGLTAFELPEGSESRLIQELQAQGQARLQRFRKTGGIPGLAEFRILGKATSSVREQARELVQYAKSVEAELIVVSSHGRKGVRRWFLGSFAETLSLHSEVPLFVVHPQRHAHGSRASRLRSILFPTDYSEGSYAVFQQVLDFASARKCRVTLFNQADRIGAPVVDLALALNPAYARAFADAETEHRKAATRWVAEGKKRGVRVQAVFDRSVRLTLADAILRRAQSQGESLIALATEGSSVSAWLLGSTARDIVRRATIPVWIVRPASEPLMRASWRDVEKDLFAHERRA